MRRVVLVPQVQRVRQDLLARQELQELRDPAQRGRSVRQVPVEVRQERPVRRDRQVLVSALQVPPDRQVLVLREQQDLRARSVRPAPRVQREPQVPEQQEQREPSVLLERRVQSVQQALWVLRALPALLVLLGPPALLEPPDPQVQQELLAQLAQLELPERLVLLELLVQLEPQEL